MVRFLVDTSIWLILAADPKADELLRKLLWAAKAGHAQFCIPDVVQQEFDRHDEKIKSQLSDSVASHLKELKRGARKALETDEFTTLDAEITKFLERLPQIKDQTANALDLVREIMTTKVLTQDTTDEMRLYVFGQATSKKAPHHQKTSLNDGLLLEHFKLLDASAAGDKKVFITDNKADFSSSKDHRLPHTDIEHLFDGTSAFYYYGVGQAVQDHVPEPPDADYLARLDEAMGRPFPFIDSMGRDLVPKPSRYGGWTYQFFHEGQWIDTGEPYDD